MATESGSRPFYRWFAFLALAVAIGSGLWYYFWGEVAATYVYETVTVDTGLIEQSVSATGSVQALITVDLSSQLSGQIAEVKVDFNSKVKEGDLLAVIDKKTFEARVKSAQANLEMAIAGVLVQKATIQKNEALVRKAEQDLARQQTLSERGATSQTLLETSKTTLATAQADIPLLSPS